MQNVHNKKLESLKKYYKNLIIFSCFLLSFSLQTEVSSAASINPCGSASSGGNCHQIINNALQSAASGSDKVVHLNDGTYWIDGNISVPSGVTLEGSRNAVVKLVNGANWAYTSSFCYDSACASPMFTSTGSNITFKGFTIDGNCKNQGRPRGKEYYKMIAMRGSHNVTFTGMAFVDGCADAINFRNGSGVTYTNNYVDCVGHEAFYGLTSSNIKAYGNTIYTCTNTAFRFDYCTGGNIEVYKNYIESSTKASSTGPGIEMAHYGNDIHIYQNVIKNLRGGAAVWMTSQRSTSDGVEINNNCFIKTGQGSWAYGNGAIIIEQYKGTKIWNNYINDGGTAAVKIGNHYSQISGSFDVTVSNNTVLNTPAVTANTVSNPSRYHFSTSGNCTGNASGSCPASCDAATGGVSPSPDGGGSSSDGGGGDSSTPTPEIDCSDRANCNNATCKDSVICQPTPPIIHALNPAPLAIIAGRSSITRATDSTVIFNGTHSMDFNGTIASYSWDFNAADGVTAEATGATATHVYNAPGKYVAVLTVRDNQGAIGMAMVNVVIKECEGNGDVDGDGFLNVGCGGDDCDDNSSAVGNKGACLNICSGNIVLGGTCQEGTGQCIYDKTVSTCENLGEACKMDACQISTNGNATCVADVSDDLCSGGLIPCGKQVDNPATAEWKENAPCDSCSMVLMGQLTIEFLVQIAAIFATLVIIIGGFLYIFAIGQPSTIEKAKSIIKYTLIGFAVVFIAWSIVNSILATVGYIDPLGGNWYTICEN